MHFVELESFLYPKKISIYGQSLALTHGAAVLCSSFCFWSPSTAFPWQRAPNFPFARWHSQPTVVCCRYRLPPQLRHNVSKTVHSIIYINISGNCYEKPMKNNLLTTAVVNPVSICTDTISKRVGISVRSPDCAPLRNLPERACFKSGCPLRPHWGIKFALLTCTRKPPIQCQPSSNV